jgi:hypothetical protein
MSLSTTRSKQTISKRHVFRLFRLGASMALTLTALVLTLIILVVGRHGDGAGDLALITVDMSKFARFNPPTIQLVHNATKTSKERRGLGDSIEGHITSAAGSVETFASGAASAVKTAASGVQTAVAGAAASAEAEADKIIGDIGDKIEDIENAVEGLMDKVLDTIQDDLNKWLHEAASSLDDMNIPNKMSLHLTTGCSSPSRNTSNSTHATCHPLFTSGKTTFNSTTNNGTIFGFQPGSILAKALGVFFVPAGAQQDIREPVDEAANEVQKLAHEAGSEVSAWTVNLLFTPIVAVYSLAAFFTGLLFLILIAATALAVKEGDSVPARVYQLCGFIGAAATFLLFLGSVVLTIVAFVTYVLGLGGNVIGISIASGSRLKWLSWGACLIMALVTGSFKVEEFVADCVFWWKFLVKIVRLGKTGGGVRKALE